MIVDSYPPQTFGANKGLMLSFSFPRQFYDAAHLVGNTDGLRTLAEALTAINARCGALLCRDSGAIGLDEGILALAELLVRTVGEG